MKGNLEKAFYELIHTRAIHHKLNVLNADVKMARRRLQQDKVSMERKIEWLEKAGYQVEVTVKK